MKTKIAAFLASLILFLGSPVSPVSLVIEWDDPDDSVMEYVPEDGEDKLTSVIMGGGSSGLGDLPGDNERES